MKYRIEMDKASIRKEPAAVKKKLNYRFHNPNTAATTADYILKVFIEVNFDKVEKAIQTATLKLPDVPKNEQEGEKRLA